MREPVWITGIGAVSAAGWSSREMWEAVAAGRSCTRPMERFPTFEAATRVAAPVPGYETGAPADRALSVEFAIAAATEAMAQAGLPLAASGVDVAIVASHGERQLPCSGRETVLGRITDPAARVATLVGAREWTGLYGACSSGVLAIGSAFKLLQAGLADVAIAGGADSLLREVDFFSFCGLYAMSTRPCPPQEASCPFDLERDGFVLSEGAALVVMETAAHARRRGARPLAAVSGYGCSQNAYHMIASPPDALGPTLAMRAALGDAQLDPANVQYINAHGTSTRDNDWCETLAIRKVYGQHAERVPISSVKGVLGHAMAAAGALETVICVQAIQHGMVPPTINLTHPDPACDLDYVPDGARTASLTHVMNNSFGFGGHSGALLVSAA
jgi:3-oxoacyl-[acyl-carrier-protein] synthase II